MSASQPANVGSSSGDANLGDGRTSEDYAEYTTRGPPRRITVRHLLNHTSGLYDYL